MVEENRFPLIVWETTEGFKKEYEEAKQRYHELSKRLFGRGFNCTYIGNLRMDGDGYPEVWLNDNHDIFRSNWSLDAAVKEALEHGNSGWWNLDEIEQFIGGKGFIFETAMWDIGFRRHKKDPTKWARRNSKDRCDPEEYGNPGHQRWDIKYKKEYETISGEELNRLNKLFVLPNGNNGLGGTYDISVGKRGLIYVCLQANPFVGTTAETLWMLGAQERNQGHINKEQNGFYIEARNILTRGDIEGIIKEGVPVKGVHIKAVKPDKSYAECVWPAQIPSQKIYDLASDLVSRVS